MRVVVAPDKFKGSLSAPDVAARLAAGLQRGGRSIAVDCAPMADGGEGTLDSALGAGYSLRTLTVTGPTGVPVQAGFAVRGTEAVVEMAAASGLDVLPGGVKDARRATSRGTGELIAAALEAGCTRIVLGVGGSASTDGGAGMLAALGAGLLDREGRELADGGAALQQLSRVDLSGLDRRLARARFVLASDVDNPLLGPAGAAAVFGPQKGASPADVADLDRGLARFADGLTAELGAPAAAAALAPGAGAAGGVGFAALAVLGAERRPGIDVVLELTGLEAKIHGADLVITGEGSLDEQSLGGKTPMGVALAAARCGVPVVAVCGRTTLSAMVLAEAGFAATFPLSEREPDVARSMANAGGLLEQIGDEIARTLPALAGAPA